MNTLVSTRIRPPVALTKQTAAVVAGRPPRKLSMAGQLLFIAVSVAVHWAGLLAFSTAPMAQEAQRTQTELAIELADERLVPPTFANLAPLGRLEQVREPRALALRQQKLDPPAPSPREVSPQPSESKSTTDSAAAPAVLASANPYGPDANAVVFSRGSGSLGARVVTSSSRSTTASALSFGIESGSADATDQAKKALAAWYDQVRSQLARTGVGNYPLRARKLGQQGTSRISVQIDALGRIVAVSLASSSGHSALDQSALTDIRSTSSVTAPPAGTGTTTLLIPITFRLN